MLVLNNRQRKELPPFPKSNPQTFSNETQVLVLNNIEVGFAAKPGTLSALNARALSERVVELRIGLPGNILP